MMFRGVMGLSLCTLAVLHGCLEVGKLDAAPPCEGSSCEAEGGAPGTEGGAPADEGGAPGDASSEASGDASNEEPRVFMVLARQQAEPSSIAVDETHVYWTDRAGGAVRSVPRSGGVVKTLVKDLLRPGQLFVDEENVYWAPTGEPCQENRLHAAAKDGTRLPTVLWTTSICHFPNRFVLAMARDAVAFYQLWGDGLIYQIAGTSVSELVGPSPARRAIAAHGDTVYWAQGNSVRRLKRPSGPPELYADNQPGVFEVAADASGVYWLTSDGTLNTLLHNSMPGVAPRGLAAVSGGPRKMALDATAVYVTTDDGRVVRIAKQDGAQTEIAVGQQNPYAITVDAHGVVFWTNLGDGTIVRH